MVSLISCLRYKDLKPRQAAPWLTSKNVGLTSKNVGLTSKNVGLTRKNAAYAARMIVRRGYGFT
jgi:hypothetical protein